MNGFAEVTSFPEATEFGARTTDGDYVPTSAGTFPLRRARYFSEAGTPSLCAEQPHGPANIVMEVDPDTKHKMIVQNLRLVVNIAKHYTNRGLGLVDLIRAGNQGLIHAMEKFEPAGGFCFSTFVTWCVSQQIELALMNQRFNQNTPQLTLADLDIFDNAALMCPKKLTGSSSGCARHAA